MATTFGGMGDAVQLWGSDQQQQQCVCISAHMPEAAETSIDLRFRLWVDFVMLM